MSLTALNLAYLINVIKSGVEPYLGYEPKSLNLAYLIILVQAC